MRAYVSIVNLFLSFSETTQLFHRELLQLEAVQSIDLVYIQVNDLLTSDGGNNVRLDAAESKTGDSSESIR